AAQSGADLDAFLQKFPINRGEPPNADIHYYFSVWNYGPDDAENVVLSNVLPAGATFESTSPDGCSYIDATRLVTCEVGTLAPDDGFFADLIVRAPSAPTAMVDTVQVSSTTCDPHAANHPMSLT